MNEVFVVGGGMAGVMAALAAKRAGAQVQLVRRAFGATALSSGAIDVAADPVAPGGELAAHLISPIDAARAVARIRPNHPYGVLRDRLERLEQTLRFAADVLPELLSAPLPRNALLPTPLGTVKPAAMGQRSMIGADLSAWTSPVAVVSLPLNPTWDAQLIAKGLRSAAERLGRTVEVQVVDSNFFDHTEDALRTPYELGERLESPGALERFAEELRGRLPERIGAVLLPPILGRRTRDLADRLSSLLERPCSEWLSPAPSLPGVRLQEALDDALDRAGIAVVEGEVDRAHAEEALRRGAVVLATGKYIGGGIRRDRRFTETLLDLPVYAGGRQVRDEHIGDLLEENAVAEQLAFRAGVRVDRCLRPLGADGRVAHERLHAAGSVLSGYDAATDKTGLGVAIFTGVLAGEWAANGPD